MNFDLIKAITDQSFVAKAYSDYCRARTEDMLAYHSMLSEICCLSSEEESAPRRLLMRTNTVSDEPVIDPVPEFVPEDFMEVTREAMYSQIQQNLHIDVLNDQVIAISNGYIHAKQLADAAYNQAAAVVARAEFPEIIIPDTPELKLDVQILNAEDVEIARMEVEEVAQALVSDARAMYASSAAALASLEGNAADKVTLYRDMMSTKFSTAYADCNDIVSAYAEKLQNGIESPALMSWIDKISGMNATTAPSADSVECPTIPASCPSFDNYGTTPSVGLAFSRVGSAANSSAKAVWKATKGVAHGLFKAGKSLFRALRTAAGEVVNPTSIEIVSKNGFPIVDGFGFSQNNVVIMQDTGSSAYDWTDVSSGETFCFQSVFGVLFLQFVSTNSYHQATWNIWFAPTCISQNDFRAFIDLFEWSEYTDGESDVVRPRAATLRAFIQQVENIRDQMHPLSVEKGHELDNLLGFYRSLFLFRAFTQAASSISANNPHLDAPVTSVYVDWGGFTSGPVTWWDEGTWEETVSDVPNSMFVNACCGYWGSGSVAMPGSSMLVSELTEFVPYMGKFRSQISGAYRPIMTNASGSSLASFQRLSSYVRPFYACLLDHLKDRRDNPQTYGFLAYRRNLGQLPAPMYRIKTDEEEQKALTLMVAAVLVTVAWASVKIVTSKISLALQKRRYLKARKNVEAFESAYAQGLPITNRAFKRYRKSRAKMNNLLSVSAGVSSNSAAQVFNEYGDANNDLLSIRTLISGSR